MKPEFCPGFIFSCILKKLDKQEIQYHNYLDVLFQVRRLDKNEFFFSSQTEIVTVNPTDGG